ncbi:MAG: HAD family hydrolase [Chloroflexi bacterium]|nr:HAD family hydrolase [Chloroflexota bacterium]
MTAVPDALAGCRLAIFDKDGTLIDFHLMWVDWVRDLADRAAAANGGERLDDLLHDVMGVDVATGRVLPHGRLAATPMRRLREATADALRDAGLAPERVASVVDAAWHAPDPVVLARPLADLDRLFAQLRAAGVHVAVATSDDREPTERTLEHFGVAGLVEALSCADDGHAVKPSPDAVHRICREIGVPELETAVIGDSPADLAMGRAAGAGRVIGVLSGVGDRAALAGHCDLLLGSVAELLTDG